jgi:4-hydroxy-tetrahydrodipicolinate synthase
MENRKTKWKGVYTAVVTPFQQNGEIDWNAYRALLKAQHAGGVAGVIPCGTTGESPTLSADEKKKLITFTLQELKGTGLKVIPGTGTNNTAESIEFSAWASDQGADAVLVVTPYYNKPSQLGLFQHFNAIADRVKCDVILYNVPGRTSVSLTADTIVRLAKHPRITAIKEASGNLAFDSEIRDALNQAGAHLALLSGDDPTFLPFLGLGGVGCISVASNLIPRQMVELQQAFEKGDQARAQELHERYAPLFKDLFIEANPVPVKFALSQIGPCGKTVRLPLAELTGESIEKLTASLKRTGLTVKT